MLIKKLTMKGFKNHIDEVKYNLGEFTLISGENFQGKTTIGEAISWAIMGTDLTGNQRATNRLLNNDSKDMEVSVEFNFEGEDNTLTRSRRGTRTDIYLNESLVKEFDLIKFYKDKDIFLSVFNPTYFAGLSPKQAKELLDSILQEVSNDEVYKELSDFEIDLLSGNGFKHSNIFLVDKRSELKELEKDVLFAEGFVSGKKEKMEIPKEMTFDDSELKKLQLRKANIENKMKELDKIEKPTLIDVALIERYRENTKSEYIRVRKEINELQSTIECPSCQFEIDLDGTSRMRLNESLGRLKIQGKGFALEIGDAESENGKMLTAYNELVRENIDEISQLKNEMSRLLKGISKEEKLQKEADLNNSNRSNLLEIEKGNVKKITKAELEIETSENKKKNIDLQIGAAKAFNSIKLKIQSEGIEKHLDKVDIQLERITKDGELKDDFKILYKDRQFVTLSNSERIMAGLEISKLVMANTGMKLPIFIDNAESITDYDKPSTQIIESRVIEDQELRVEG